MNRTAQNVGISDLSERVGLAAERVGALHVLIDHGYTINMDRDALFHIIDLLRNEADDLRAIRAEMDALGQADGA